MPQTLQSVVSPSDFALQSIPLYVLSPRGGSTTFIIVESEYDQLTYQKFFNSRSTHIYTSALTEKNSSENCDNVEEIVNTLQGGSII